MSMAAFWSSWGKMEFAEEDILGLKEFSTIVLGPILCGVWLQLFGALCALVCCHPFAELYWVLGTATL